MGEDQTKGKAQKEKMMDIYIYNASASENFIVVLAAVDAHYKIGTVLLAESTSWDPIKETYYVRGSIPCVGVQEVTVVAFNSKTGLPPLPNFKKGVVLGDDELYLIGLKKVWLNDKEKLINIPYETSIPE